MGLLIINSTTTLLVLHIIILILLNPVYTFNVNVHSSLKCHSFQARDNLLLLLLLVTLGLCYRVLIKA